MGNGFESKAIVCGLRTTGLKRTQIVSMMPNTSDNDHKVFLALFSRHLHYTKHSTTFDSMASSTLKSLSLECKRCYTLFRIAWSKMQL